MTAPVRHCPGGQLPPDLAAIWRDASLAEVTHAPSGHSGLGTSIVEFAPDAVGAAQAYPDGPALLVVLAGRLAIDFGTMLGATIEAVAGDSVAIAPGHAHRERAADASEPVRFVRFAPAGPPVPA